MRAVTTGFALVWREAFLYRIHIYLFFKWELRRFSLDCSSTFVLWDIHISMINKNKTIVWLDYLLLGGRDGKLIWVRIQVRKRGVMHNFTNTFNRWMKINGTQSRTLSRSHSCRGRFLTLRQRGSWGVRKGTTSILLRVQDSFRILGREIRGVSLCTGFKVQQWVKG